MGERDLSFDTEGFRPLDWEDEYDAEAVLAQSPDLQIRGVLVNDVLTFCKKRNVPPPTTETFNPIRHYSHRAYMRLCLDAVASVYPTSPVRRGLYEIGRTAYPTMAESMVGKALFTMAGNSFVRAARLAAKGYAVAATMGTARVHLDPSGGNRMIVESREIWGFVDSLHVGVWAGALETFGHVGTIRVRNISPCDADFLIEWD